MTVPGAAAVTVTSTWAVGYWPGAAVFGGTASMATRIVAWLGLTVGALFASKKTWSPTSRSTGVLLV